ncbi:Amino acid transporter protein [Phaffia rhodozyma]|uniref:Amino acid transporter protein n=1 Tax=Phaffia rhodozyma TaxID=264483 RepID=A0A0F7SXD8_PHARH|nr:Amino acid transporter protein [Phaffia rhodozyma]
MYSSVQIHTRKPTPPNVQQTIYEPLLHDSPDSDRSVHHEGTTDDDDDDLKLGRFQGGRATVFSSVSNLANTILGTGMLAFPYAFASIGIIPGIFSCAFSGSMAFFGLYLLSICAAKVEPPRSTSFNAISMLTFGKRATVFFDLAIAIKCFGVSISYLIIIKTLTSTALTTLYTIISGSDEIPQILISHRLWLLLSMSINIPLAFFKKLDSLRFTSQAALVFVLYMLAIVITYYFHRPHDIEPAGPVKYFKWSHGAIGTFPVQIFAYTCAQNLFPVYNELKENTQKRMNIVIGTSIGSATVIYEIIALAGYLTFGSKVKSNIVEMYSDSSLFVALGRLGIVLMVLFSYPLQVHPCRAALDKVISTVWKDKETLIQVPREEEEGDAQVVVPSLEMSKVRFISLVSRPFLSSLVCLVNILNADYRDSLTLCHSIIWKQTTGIILAGLAIALSVDHLETVLSFVGATGSTTISFILPGLFYFSLFRHSKERSPVLTWAALGLAIYGICVMCFCLTYNIIQLLN